MKLLGSTKGNKTTENDENVPYLKINEAVLIHCNVADISYLQNSTVLYTLFQTNCLVNY